MSSGTVKWKCLACWDENLSPYSSLCGESAALINSHMRHVSPFVHSCVQQHLKPCHQGDAVWVYRQMCGSFSRTETKASSGPWLGAYASTTSQKTTPFDLRPALDFRMKRKDEWEKNTLAPFAREIKKRMWLDVDTCLNFFFKKSIVASL